MKISPETTSGKPKKVMILVPCPPGSEVDPLGPMEFTAEIFPHGKRVGMVTF